MSHLEHSVVYAIRRPQISKALKRTFYKDLEVFKGICKEPTSTKPYRCDELFYHEEGEYKTKKCIQLSLYKPQHIHSEIPDFSTLNAEYLFFHDLEMAFLCKCLLVKELGKSYEAEIQKLQNTFKRNVPDVSEHLDRFKKEMPELFI
jgi:hypothetical protein